MIICGDIASDFPYSYIISESFLLGLNLLIEENAKKETQLIPSIEDAPSQGVPAANPTEPAKVYEPDNQEKIALFLTGLQCLTPKERQLYDCYISGMTTDVIMEQLHIKENTLKFHSKNLYSKLGVKSRKHLMELHKIISAKDSLI